MRNRDEFTGTNRVDATDNTVYKQARRLEPVTKTHSIVDGLQARVKDPLWMLGRQWQVGEFKAHNGGHPVRTELEVSSQPINTIEWKTADDDDSVSESFDLQMPLEMKVEAEKPTPTGKFVAQGWNPRRLEYSFKLKNNRSKTELISEEYLGTSLDWYNFDLLQVGNFAESGEVTTKSLKPTPLTFRGMPLSRWWSMEDKQVDLGKIKRPNLNFLTMLLLEFAFIYSHDWYVIPLEQSVGHLRHIDKLIAIDSFGVVSHAKPVIDKSVSKQHWELFTLSPAGEAEETTDGRLFYLPNTLYHALESDPIEQVNLFRDEMANLVWAVETHYQNDAGEVINRNDEDIEARLDPELEMLYWDTQTQTLIPHEYINEEGEPGNRYLGPVAHYQPRTYIPSHWIPYQSTLANEYGDYSLRRSRTIENPSGGPQYKGHFLHESKHIFVNEVPRVGITICRVIQMARDSQGVRYTWCGRKKQPAARHKSSGLRFDALL